MYICVWKQIESNPIFIYLPYLYNNNTKNNSQTNTNTAKYNNTQLNTLLY